jgi:anti-sigma B factor antagonist
MSTTQTEAVVRRRNGIVVVDLSGNIDASAESELTRSYGEATQGGNITTIVLNFARVGYINSTGIALIVGLMARARKDGLSMAACGLSDHYKEIFEITRLADFMPVFPDEDAALGAA